MAEGKSRREAAKRVFAREFNSATVELPSEDQYTPSYVLSPIGTLINRVYLTGVLTECENVGTTEEPLWRGRVSDPTDVFYISAGQFQPKAARILADLEPPALVGIIGKARTYSTDDGTTYVSIRVEVVKEITQELRDYWVLEACQHLHKRLNCMLEALRMEPPEIKKLTALGYSNNLATGVVEAITQFGTIDVGGYGELLSNTLKELSHDTSTDKTLISSAPTESKDSETSESIGSKLVEQSDEATSDQLDNNVSEEVELATDEIKPNKVKDKESISAESDTQQEEQDNEISEQLIIEIISSLVEENPDGVNYDDIQERASEHGLDKSVIEECIGSLIDKGVIYEPSIGIFKAVS